MGSLLNLAQALFASLLLALLVSGVSHAELMTAKTTQRTNSTVAFQGKVNINTADAATLAKYLKGVGLKKAKAIIDYRKTYGAFVSVDELTEVKGIGPGILKRNLAVITLH